MRKIYLFGGSFNPLHNDHVRIVKDIVKIMGEDDSLFIAPCSRNPLETKPMAPFEQRTGWCCDMFMPIDSRIEVDIYGYVYFMDYLLRIIRDEEDPDECEFIIVVGSDEANQVHKWKSIKTIEKLAAFYVIPRRNNAISSSEIRTWINEGKWDVVSNYVPKEMMKILNPWWESVEV